MSIISNNKNAREVAKDKFWAAVRELEKVRQLTEDRCDMEEANAILDAITILSASKKPMTAAELSRAVGGSVSVMELVGNMPYVGKDGYEGEGVSRYKALRKEARHVESRSIRKTIHYAEVDNDGQVIPGGKVKAFTRYTTTYTVKDGPRKCR